MLQSFLLKPLYKDPTEHTIFRRVLTPLLSHDSFLRIQRPWRPLAQQHSLDFLERNGLHTHVMMLRVNVTRCGNEHLEAHGCCYTMYR